MQFNPCVSGRCTDQGTHCQGCGRSHEEIAETKKLVKELVTFAQNREYENYGDFAAYIAKSFINKMQNPT